MTVVAAPSTHHVAIRRALQFGQSDCVLDTYAWYPFARFQLYSHELCNVDLCMHFCTVLTVFFCRSRITRRTGQWALIHYEVPDAYLASWKPRKTFRDYLDPSQPLY